MPLSQLMAEHQRLVILRLLSEVNGYDLNASILQDGLNAYGLDISRDGLLTQLAWLEEQNLVTLNRLIGTTLATLNSRGLDVVNGHARVPGIKRPSPGE